MTANNDSLPNCSDLEEEAGLIPEVAGSSDITLAQFIYVGTWAGSLATDKACLG